MSANSSKLLQEHYEHWIPKNGDPKHLRAFAAHLGIHEVTFNRLYHGVRSLTPTMAANLATRLNDPRFLTAAGLLDFDPELKKLVANWKSTSNS